VSLAGRDAAEFINPMPELKELANDLVPEHQRHGIARPDQSSLYFGEIMAMARSFF
jgi:hypothetical protein